MNKNKNNPDTEHILQLVAKFEPQSVREMSVEEYEAEFDTKFPVPVPTPKPARPKIVDPWIRIAEEILERDFCEEPINRSTMDSWVIGLRAKIDPASKAALTKLKRTKPVAWGEKDKAVGKLLPRRKRNQ
ncbi:hypothetical protein N8584_01565 [bacterium]|nr:hypothetical protein [bacterium]MDA7680086.1 hypothetical protein [bacterium]